MKLHHVLFNLKINTIFVVFLFSCANDDPPSKHPIQPITVTNLVADPPTIFPTNNPPIGYKNKFKFFSFKMGTIVPNTDSATNRWDIGFMRTTIIVNGGTSGPGLGGALIKDASFDQLLEIPEEGYRVDDKNIFDKYAIPATAGAGWYEEKGSLKIISPIPGKVILIKTADGRYAKIEILSYYKDAPASPISNSLQAYYTFKYVYQPAGSASF